MSKLSRWLLISATAIALAGCGTGAKVPDTSSFSDIPTTQSVPPSSASSAPPSVQWESSSPASSAPPDTTSHAAEPTQSHDQSAGTSGMANCGMVTAGSGKAFKVTASENVGCAVGKRIVSKFAKQVASKQADQPSKAVKSQVDGFSCVAGPASGQGGTICSKGRDSTVMGAVVESE